MTLNRQKIDRRRKIAGGLVSGVAVAVLIGYSVSSMIGGKDELIPPGDTTSSAILLQLLASRDMGHLPARSGWCSLVRDAEHCWLLQGATGDATDYGTPGGWDLSESGSPRRAVPGYMPVSDGDDGISWDEAGVGIDVGDLMVKSSVEICDATTLSMTYLYTPMYASDELVRVIKHYAAGTSSGFIVYSPDSAHTQRISTYSGGAGGGGTFHATTTDDGAPHCRTISWDRSVEDGVNLYLDGALDGTGDASGDGPFTGTDDFSIGDASIGGPVVVYRVRLDCGATTDLAGHQTLCGSLYEDPSDAYSSETELEDADATYTHSGGARCYQTEEHSATCIPGGTLGWAWSATLDASAYGGGYGWPGEPGRTNRVLYSSDIDCADWTCTTTADATPGQIAPDGTATASLVGCGGATRYVYSEGTGYTGDADLYPLVWIRCTTGATDTIEIKNTNSHLDGSWDVDCATLGDEWELVSSAHAAVTENHGWTADATGDAGIWFDADYEITFYAWLPTLTEISGISVIPTEAAAVATGDPSWEIDNGTYYEGKRGKLSLTGDWITAQALDVYAADYRGRSYGDGAEWLLYDDGPHDATQVSGGGYHTCAVHTDGTVSCWGRDNFGQSTPPADSDFSQVSAGLYHTCAVHTDGTISCWGWDNYGQSTPPADSDFSQVSGGGKHTCAVHTDGTVSCWGRDNYNQATPPADSDFSQVSAGEFHTCAVHTDGTISCWGYDGDGRATPPADSDFSQVTGGENHTCAVHTDGTISCWGYDGDGQATPPADSDFSQVSGGGYHTCAVHTDGTVSCWGRDNFGQSTPPADSDFSQVTGGENHTCAVHTDGTVSCWGRDDYGQLRSGRPILQCDADMDTAIPFVLRWDSSSTIPGAARHAICTLGGTEQSYTIDPTTSWTPATPDTIKLWSQSSVGILYELKIEGSP